VSSPRRPGDDEDLLCEHLREGANELLTRVALAFTAEAAWVDQLRAVAYEMLRFLQENPARAYTMTVEVLSAGPRAQAVRDDGARAPDRADRPGPSRARRSRLDDARDRGGNRWGDLQPHPRRGCRR
jgi:hypothetical protein